MSEQARKWWPHEWADEVMPPGRLSPDDFIQEANVGIRLGYAAGAPGVTDQELELGRAIAIGHIVSFICCDVYEDIEIVFADDGTYTVRGTVPAMANSFVALGDNDTLADSIAELVKVLPDQWGAISTWDEKTITVGVAFWSEPIPLKLVGSAGKLHFATVSAAEARQ